MKHKRLVFMALLSVILLLFASGCSLFETEQAVKNDIDKGISELKMPNDFPEDILGVMDGGKIIDTRTVPGSDQQLKSSTVTYTIETSSEEVRKFYEDKLENLGAEVVEYPNYDVAYMKDGMTYLVKTTEADGIVTVDIRSIG